MYKLEELDEGKIIRRLYHNGNVNSCVSCGKIIPEGDHVCKHCQKSGGYYSDYLTDKEKSGAEATRKMVNIRHRKFEKYRKSPCQKACQKCDKS